VLEFQIDMAGSIGRHSFDTGIYELSTAVKRAEGINVREVVLLRHALGPPVPTD
jgi:hypothetical protein